MKPVIILGAGGHAKVLIDLLQEISVPVIGLTDPAAAAKPAGLLGLPVLGDDSVILEYSPDAVDLVNGLGTTGPATQRRDLYETFTRRGYAFRTLIHPAAVISRHAVIRPGTQVMAGAVIQAGCEIRENVIINTRASVDHDCLIGSHSHIAPGVTCSGGVRIGSGVHVGSGAVIIQGIAIGEGSIVGAGAVVAKTVESGVLVTGIPAKVVRSV